MRLAGLAVLCATTASAQTEADLRATVGVGGQSVTATFLALGTVDAMLDRSFDDTLAVAARVVATVTATSDGALVPRDLGSGVAIRFRRPTWETEAVFIELYPVDGLRLHPTFDPANQWGAPARPLGAAPALRAEVVREGTRIWAGAQAYPQTALGPRFQKIGWTALLGGGFALAPQLQADLIVAVADRGVVPGLANQGILAPVFATGASARLGWEAGGGVGPAHDPASIDNDPDSHRRLFAREVSDAPRAASISIEGGIATQELENPDIFASLKRVLTGHLDVQLRARFSALRLFGTFRFRGTGLVPFDAPGVPFYKALPADAATDDEYTVLLGLDRRIERLALTPGLTLRMLRPASFRAPALSVNGFRLTTESVWLSGKSTFGFLSARPVPRFDVIGTLRFDRLALVRALLVVQYTWDQNLARLLDTMRSNPAPERFSEHGVSVQLLVQLAY